VEQNLMQPITIHILIPIPLLSKSFGTPEADQNFKTKFVFFFNHKSKPLPKLALPIKNKNTQKIASWYMTYIQ
jgi:hypothetical protein